MPEAFELYEIWKRGNATTSFGRAMNVFWEQLHASFLAGCLLQPRVDKAGLLPALVWRGTDDVCFRHDTTTHIWPGGK